jgi:hypothetical protein
MDVGITSFPSQAHGKIKGPRSNTSITECVKRVSPESMETVKEGATQADIESYMQIGLHS